MAWGYDLTPTLTAAQLQSAAGINPWATAMTDAAAKNAAARAAALSQHASTSALSGLLTSYTPTTPGRWTSQMVGGVQQWRWQPETTAATPTTPVTTGPTGTGTATPTLPTLGYAGQVPSQLLSQTAASLAGALRGELPQDVQDLLRQQAAEYGVAAGLPGSQFAGYRGLRNLGLTSLSRMQEAERLLAPMFTSPAQAEQLAQGRTKLGLEQQAITLDQAMRQQQLAAQLAAQSAARTGGTSYISPIAAAGGGGAAETPVIGRQPTAMQTGADVYRKYAGTGDFPTWLPFSGAAEVGQYGAGGGDEILAPLPVNLGALTGRDFTAPGLTEDNLATQTEPWDWWNAPTSDLAEYYGYTPEEWETFGGIYG